jgi:hypothetical protein
MKEDEMSEGCSTHERDEKSIRIVIRKPGGGKTALGGLGVDGRIALQ